MTYIKDETLKITPQDQLLYEHDKEILVIKQRLNTLENICNKIQNKYNLYWENIED